MRAVGDTIICAPPFVLSACRGRRADREGLDRTGPDARSAVGLSNPTNGDRLWTSTTATMPLRATACTARRPSRPMPALRRSCAASTRKDLTGVDVAVTGVPLDTATTNRPGRAFRTARDSQRVVDHGLGKTVRHGVRSVRQTGGCRRWRLLFRFRTPEKVPDADRGACLEYHQRGPRPADAWVAITSSPIRCSRHTRENTAHRCRCCISMRTATPGRIADDRIDHGTMFYWAAKYGIVDPATSVQIGLRTSNPDTLGFNVLDAPWVHEHGIDAVITGGAQGPRRPAGLRDLRYRLPRSELCTRHRHAGLRRPDQSPGHGNPARSEGHQHRRHGRGRSRARL